MKAPKPTKDQIKAAELVFACMAMVETIRPVVDKYQRENLTKLGYPGLDPEQLYTIPDSIWPEYLSMCNESRKAAGLHVESDEFCPLLVAESDLRNAQRLLIDAMESTTKLSFDLIIQSKNALENLKQYINLTLRFMAPFVSNNVNEILR